MTSAGERRERRERALGVLARANGHMERWRDAQEKAWAQLRSMSNLAEQLAALCRCREAGRLGCLAPYPRMGQLLEAKILASFERALGFVHRHCETLAGSCKEFKSCWKESEKLLNDVIGLQGDAQVALFSTVDEFSLGEITEWLKHINATYLYDLREKQEVLHCVACTTNSMERVCSIWNREPTEELAEILESVQYTLKHSERTGTG